MLTADHQRPPKDVEQRPPLREKHAETEPYRTRGHGIRSPVALGEPVRFPPKASLELATETLFDGPVPSQLRWKRDPLRQASRHEHGDYRKGQTKQRQAVYNGKQSDHRGATLDDFLVSFMKKRRNAAAHLQGAHEASDAREHCEDGVAGTPRLRPCLFVKCGKHKGNGSMCENRDQR